MAVFAPPEHRPAELRVQCRKPEPARDPWEEEAERLQEFLALPGGGNVMTIRPVQRDSHAWGTPIDKDTAACIRSHAGHPLDSDMRHDFEARLNRNLGDVRIHDDQAARDLVHSLGAEAFTLGDDIFTSRTDRALLAHEIVHTIQQEIVTAAEPARVQASFEKTTADLDPKVEILLNLHLRSRGKRLKEIAETKLLVADSWWLKLRAKLEEKDPTRPVDEKAKIEKAKVEKTEIENAVKKIEKELKPLDTGADDPIQNAVAGLLADYLRINDAPELAALVVIEFPYSRTAVPASEVVNALRAEEKRGKCAVVPMSRIWKTEKPKGAVATTWTQEITDAVNQFLALTPLKDHTKQRQQLVDGLKAPLRSTSNIPDSGTSPPPFERLTDKSILTSNELDEFARRALNFLRTGWASVLQQRITASEQQTSSTPFTLWGNDVERVKNIVEGITEASLRELKVPEDLLPVLIEANSRLKKELQPAVQTHYDFWLGVLESSKTQVPGEADAQLLFAADQGALVAHLQDVVRPLADAAAAYFDLFDTPALPPLKERATALQLLANHRDRADAFGEKLRINIQPTITRKIQLARVGGKPELARGLGWFGQMMENIHSTLRDVSAIDEDSTADVQIDGINKRLGIAALLFQIAVDALGENQAASSGSTQPGGEAQRASRAFRQRPPGRRSSSARKPLSSSRTLRPEFSSYGDHFKSRNAPKWINSRKTWAASR